MHRHHCVHLIRSAFAVCLLASLGACRSAPDIVAAPPVPDELVGTFVNVIAESGLSGSGFSAWGDYNNDGHADVVVGSKLYRNNGNGAFTHVESFAGGDGVWADYDNDGLIDFYCVVEEGRLIRNLGDDEFEDVLIPPNPEKMSRAAAWADANNDGHVDLYVTNYETWPPDAFADLMYINNGDGTFAEPVRYPPKWKWRARGVNWCDFDNDGDQDFYVSNYRLQPNQFWVNDGQGNFTDEAKQRGVHGIDDDRHINASKDTPKYNANGHTIGSCFGDVNGDGHMDLVVINFAHGAKYQDRTMVCINSGPPAYTFTNTNIDAKAGIHYQESYAKGALGDYDNDGDLDLYITTVYSGDNGTLFENDGAGHFTDVGEKSGTRGCNSYGLAWVDYDNDGDLDLHSGGKLLRNLGNNNAWIKIKVVGNGKSNRVGIGSRITVTAGDKTYIREIQAGNSGNQNEPFAHVGLGRHEGRVNIKVRFPSGKVVTKRAHPRQVVEMRES